jgi:FkbM family methyltransferase
MRLSPPDPMSLFRKIKLSLRLRSLLKRYPKTIIVGGPPLLAWLGAKRASRPNGFYSQCGQDAFLLTHLYQRITKPDFPATFVDVGCNHPVKHNNSYFFERHMGFKVLGVDALPTHQQAWAQQRPKADLVITAVGEREGTVEFEEVERGGRDGDMFSGVKGVSDKAGRLGRRIRTVPETPLTQILLTKGLASVGIMSIDVEGYEMQALLGLDLEAIKVHIIILENNSNDVLGDDRIRAHLIARGYHFVARIWGIDDVFLLPDPSCK